MSCQLSITDTMSINDKSINKRDIANFVSERLNKINEIVIFIHLFNSLCLIT